MKELVSPHVFGWLSLNKQQRTFYGFRQYSAKWGVGVV
jgi:hypothetical protein